MSNNVKLKKNQVVTYSPVNKYGKPQLATKSLIIKDGKRQKINHFKNTYSGYIKQHTLKGFNEFSDFLKQLESDPYTFVVRGSIREKLDLSKPYPRRKLLEKYQAKGQGHTVAFKESEESWIAFDIDKLPLENFCINQPVHELDIPATIELILDTYAPELKGVSYHYQLSSSCGWTDSSSISLHLFFVLKTPLDNASAKEFAKAINARAGFGLFDPALYQAVQPHFTAAPIIEPGAIDVFQGRRSGAVQHDNDYLDLEPVISDILNSDTVNTVNTVNTLKAKPKQKTKAKALKPLVKAPVESIATFEGWLKHFETVDNLHNEVRAFSNWVYANKFWGLTPKEIQAVFKALEKSPRIKSEPGRLDRLKAGEWQNLMASAKERQLLKRIEKYRALLPKADLEVCKQGVHFDLAPKKVMLIDSPMANGKTNWAVAKFYPPEKNYESEDDTSVYVTPLKFLAKQFKERMPGVAYYEDVKQSKKKHLYNLSVCVNSLLNDKINSLMPSKPDLIIDEIETIGESILAGTVKDKDKKTLLERLSTLVNDSKTCVGMQHRISDVTLKTLEYLGIPRESIFLARNTYKPYKGLPTYFHKDEKKMMDELHAAVEAGGKGFIGSNSKKRLEELYEGLKKKYPKTPLLLVTADTKDIAAVQDFLQRPNKESKKYSWILFSPAMATGVSIVNLDYTTTFLFLNSQAGNTPSDCSQMGFRGRTVKTLHVFSDSKKGDMPKNPKVWIAQATANFIANNVEQAAEYFSNNASFNPPPEISELLELQASVLAKRATEKSDFIGMLYAELKDGLGCDIHFVDSKGSKQAAEIKRESKEVVRTKTKTRILASNEITPTQYEELKKESTRTNPTLQRFEFEQTMQVHIDNKLELKADMDSNDIQQAYDQYVAENPDIVQALEDYDEGRLKKKHIFLSEACTPEQVAKKHAAFIWAQRKRVGVQLKLKLEFSFWLRWQLFQLLMPLVGLKAENWTLKPINGFEFTYQDVLKNKPFMDFVIKHAEALQLSGLTRFKGKKPTEKIIQIWLADMGLKPTGKQVRLKDKRVRVYTWTDDFYLLPAIKLLAKYNAIENFRAELKAKLGTAEQTVEQQTQPVESEKDTWANFYDQDSVGGQIVCDDDFAYMLDDLYALHTWGGENPILNVVNF